MKFIKLSSLLLVSVTLFTFNPAAAMKVLETAELETPGTNRVLLLPAEAVNSHVIFLGTAIDPQSGRVVEGFVFVHPRDNSAKPPWAGGGGKDKGGTPCYTVLAKDAKWKVTEDYIVDGSNNAGLNANDVSNLIATSLNTWDSEVASNIFGSEVVGAVNGADEISPDGKNEVLFADVSTPGAIAVTITWGIFNGPPSQRELVEWDQVYDDTDFTWSTSGAANDMDFQNIATHEIGHALGLGHPEDTCVNETMYRYASEGETNKRDLEIGDVAGIEKLYN
jgi:hypothetical protein